MSKKLDTILDDVTEKVALEDMPLTSIRDYRLYNEEARRLNIKAKKQNKAMKEAVHTIKQCPVELHPTQRVAVQDNSQPNNPIKVFLSNELIHFDKTLTPGKEYDLPQCVVTYLADKATAKMGYVNLPDGTRETRIINKIPRFSVRTVYAS
jgi:hypothetical protein